MASSLSAHPSALHHNDAAYSAASSSDPEAGGVPRHTSGAPAPLAEPVVDDGAALDANIARGSPVSPLVRFLNSFTCGMQDLRMLLMLLPCLTILLFVSGQRVAGGLVLAATLLVLVLVCYRISMLLRLRQRQMYESVPGAGGVGSLALAMGANVHGHSISALRAHALRNPTALRLAMVDRDFTADDYDLLGRLDTEHAAQSFTGIPASQLERLPTWTLGPQKTTAGGGAVKDPCTICLEEKVEGQKVRSLLCMHTFHQSCIDPWLRTSTKCPVCQFKVQLS